MRDEGAAPDAFFFRHRFGRAAPPGELSDLLRKYTPAGEPDALWDEEPPSLVIGEVEALWAGIAERDDWAPLTAKVAAIRRLGAALGPPPAPG